VVVVHGGQWTLRTVDPFALKGLKAFVCCGTSSDKCRNSCNMGNNNQHHSRTCPLAGYKIICFLSWIILFSYKRWLRVFLSLHKVLCSSYTFSLGVYSFAGRMEADFLLILSRAAVEIFRGTQLTLPMSFLVGFSKRMRIPRTAHSVGHVLPPSSHQ
jgi:hypothetical protein